MAGRLSGLHCVVAVCCNAYSVECHSACSLCMLCMASLTQGLGSSAWTVSCLASKGCELAECGILTCTHRMARMVTHPVVAATSNTVWNFTSQSQVEATHSPSLAVASYMDLLAQTLTSTVLGSCRVLHQHRHALTCKAPSCIQAEIAAGKRLSLHVM